MGAEFREGLGGCGRVGGLEGNWKGIWGGREGLEGDLEGV